LFYYIWSRPLIVNALVKQLNGVGRGYSFEILRAKSLYWSEAHKGPTTARKKPPTNFDPYRMDYIGPLSLFGKVIYLTGDMSDISVLLDRFDEIF